MRRRIHHTRTPARAWRACVVLLALAFASVAWSAGLASSATTMLVGTDIPGSTTLVTTGCAPNTVGITDFGVVTPGSTVMTSTDCSVAFGSTSDSAALRMTQADGSGSAMGTPGNTWTRQAGASSTRYGAVRSAGSFVWALRTTGGLLRSADSGATWPINLTGLCVPGPSCSNHSSLSLPLAAAGWMTGDGTGVVMRSSNADHATSPIWAATAATPGIVTSGVAGIDAANAWVVGDGGQISRTSNGGGSWTPFTWSDAPGGPPSTAVELDGINRLAGDPDSFAAWGPTGRVLATSDGATWRDISLSVNITSRDVELVTDDHMVVVSSSSIYVTTNATNATPTWISRTVPMIPDMIDVEFQDASNGMIVGMEGTVLRTSDGGVTWSREHVDTSHDIYGVARVGATTWVAAGTGQNIIRSLDSGSTWNSVLTQNAGWRDVSMSTSSTGWRVGNDGLVHKTTNGGVSWVLQTSNTTADLFGVRAFDTLRAVAVGRDGVAVTTADGGSTWTVRTTGTASDLAKVETRGASAWAVGTNGTIAHSTDHGVTWAIRRSQSGVYLRDVAVTSPSSVVAVGENGTAYRSTDMGASWTTLALPSASWHAEQIVANPATGYAYYYAGLRMYRSVDAGVTWVDRGLIPAAVTALDLVDRDTLVAATGGTIRTSIDGGATWTSMASASNFSSHTTNGIDMFDLNSGVAVANGNATGIMGFGGAIDNYVIGVSDWIADGTEAFGVCLRTTTANAAWIPNATCDQSADGGHWRAVPTASDAAAEVATTAAGDGNRAASFRFGLRIANAEPPGQLSAGVTFVVLAPDP